MVRRTAQGSEGSADSESSEGSATDRGSTTPMTPEALSAFCLGFAATTAEYPFDEDTCAFKVQGKIFAISRLTDRPLTVSLKCDPEVAVTLRATHPGIVPGYHLNKRHWNTITVDDALPAGLVEQMIEDSWDLVVGTLTKFQQQRLR